MVGVLKELGYSLLLFVICFLLDLFYLGEELLEDYLGLLELRLEVFFYSEKFFEFVLVVGFFLWGGHVGYY
jgi:hypothetical protein